MRYVALKDFGDGWYVERQDIDNSEIVAIKLSKLDAQLMAVELNRALMLDTSELGEECLQLASLPSKRSGQRR